MKDSDVIKLILQGDKEKFRFLVEEYQQLVFQTCMGFVHNKDDADDLTQEIFIQAYQSLSRFKGDSAFSTWLYRIAVNASLNKTRKSALKSIFHRLDYLPGDKKEKDHPSVSIPDEEDPEKILIHNEDVEWVTKALDGLPGNQRKAIVLSKYDDLSQKEIAEIMDTTEGAVEALLVRAKKNLRDKLSVSRKKNR